MKLLWLSASPGISIYNSFVLKNPEPRKTPLILVPPMSTKICSKNLNNTLAMIIILNLRLTFLIQNDFQLRQLKARDLAQMP